MKFSVEVAARIMTVEITEQGVSVDGTPVEASLLGQPGSALRRLARGRHSRSLTAHRGDEPGSWKLVFDGARVDALVLDERARIARKAGTAAGGVAGVGTSKAPMPGLVVRVLVAEGDEVKAGQGLVVVEAMKMENELKAGRAGRVSRVHVASGSRVEKGALLVELE